MGKLAKKIKDKRISKFFSSESYDRNLDLMKLLVSDKDFQKIVSDARELLQIPAEGFEDKDDGSISQWYDWLVEESDKIILSRSFSEEGRRIHQQLKNKLISYSEFLELNKKLHDRLPLNYFSSIAKSLAKRFNIPNHFKESIQRYILSHKIDAPQHNYAGGLYEAGEKPWEAGYIPINIYTRLTKDEWEELKNYVDSMAKKWLPKHPKILKIDEYIKVEKVFNDRKKQSNTDEPGYSMTWAEISETALGNKSEGSKARDMVRKIERLRKARLTRPERGPKAGKK